MFESIQDSLSTALRSLSGRGKLSESNMREALGQVEQALLEADVSYSVVRQFIDRVAEEAVGDRYQRGGGYYRVARFHDGSPRGSVPSGQRRGGRDSRSRRCQRVTLRRARMFVLTSIKPAEDPGLHHVRMNIAQPLVRWRSSGGRFPGRISPSFSGSAASSG